MPDKNQTDEIWQQISGANRLREIYGYFPTLHDAIVKHIDIRWDVQEVIFTVEYNDLVEKPAGTTEGQETATTRFQLCWREVKQAKLNLRGADLYGVSFCQRDDFIETHFADYSFGCDGLIVARSIEFLEIEQVAEAAKETSDLCSP